MDKFVFLHAVKIGADKVTQSSKRALGQDICLIEFTKNNRVVESWIWSQTNKKWL